MSNELTEYQISLMRVCNNCEERSVFNMKIKDKSYAYDWCNAGYHYISLNTIHAGCKFNEIHLNKREPIMHILKRKLKSIKQNI